MDSISGHSCSPWTWQFTTLKKLLIGQIKRWATSQDVFECLQIPRETVLIPNDINFKKGMLSIFKIITQVSSFMIALVLRLIAKATPFVM